MSAKRIVPALCAAILCIAHLACAGPTLTTLVSFTFASGVNPEAGILVGADGNLYGTTSYRGPGNYGTVFELSGTNHQTLTTLASFSGTNGYGPQADLIADGTGNLYGTTVNGGTNNDGTVFELSGTTHQTLTTLANIYSTNGVHSIARLVTDAAGNLYGTTLKGGAHGNGEVFELSGTNYQTITTLLNFDIGDAYPNGNINANGAVPYSGLVADSAGNLYGTTSSGGAYGDGTVFELSGANHQTLTILATFDGTNGNAPLAGLIVDAAGNLYGTTSLGGPAGANGDGTVFELSGTNHQTLTTLMSFNGTDGQSPQAALILDAAGNLYGTTANVGEPTDDGTVFELSGTNYQTFTTLVTFTGGNGAIPDADLTADAAGNLYGTTVGGGTGSLGTVFELTNTGFVVPEPGSLSLLAIGAMALLNRRRRVA